ncbi:MAG: glycosyltransferase family 4 protein [Omnitrophica WOR_2 bacterium]
MIALNPFTHDARVMKEARTLVSKGHQVTVNALWSAGLPVRESIEDVQVFRLRLKSREGKHIPLAVWTELLPGFIKAIRSQKPAVVHGHELNALIPAYFAARICHVRLIYDSHEFEIGRRGLRNRAAAWKRSLWKLVEGYLIHRSDAVVTVSPSIAKELSRIYKVPLPEVVMNCPDLIDLPPTGRIHQWLGIPLDCPIILFQGGLSKGRGLEAVVQAISRVPGCHFVMLGEGQLRTELEGLAQKMNISDRVHLPGLVPLHDLISYTRDAALGACLIEKYSLSYYYSLPNKLFEYLMAGIPVLASDFPDMRRIVETSGAGVVADPSRIDLIARAIAHLLADPVRLREMAGRARAAAETRYNWGIEAGKLLAIYSRLDSGV